MPPRFSRRFEIDLIWWSLQDLNRAVASCVSFAPVPCGLCMHGLSLTPLLLLLPAKFLNLSGAPFLLSEVTGSAPVKNKNKQGRQKCLPCFLVVVTGLEPRRRKLRIFRARALRPLYARALIHSAAPSSPQKGFWPFRGPRVYFGGHRFGIRNGTINKKDKPNGLSHLLVVVTGLEPVTSRTSSGCAPSCATRPGIIF